ncbi:MAG: hypothetical protein DHS20C15_00980 [Planctomycetota bacterium]|nr:MAG: hypothetical protein DHS20C15_00980 [Planctomycetota bacterium]
MSPRVLVVSDVRRSTEERLAALGAEIVRRDPELVFCHGGDGTLLRAERWHPGVPKLVCRQDRPGVELCEAHTLEAVWRRHMAGELNSDSLSMLELRVGRARFVALNDVVLRNAEPATAVRFRVIVDGKASAEFSGDGLVIATPFGSSGYFRSVSGQQIERGIGLAFNNSTHDEAPRLLSSEAHIEVQLARGPAVLVYDNDARPILLREGHRFEVRSAAQHAEVIGLDALACQRCRRSGGQAFNPH